MSASKVSPHVARRREERDRILRSSVRGGSKNLEQAVRDVYQSMFGSESDRAESGQVITPADERDALAVAREVVRDIEKIRKLRGQIDVLAVSVRAEQGVVVATRGKARTHAQSRREKARIALVRAEEALQRIEDNYPRMRSPEWSFVNDADLEELD